MLKFLLTPLAKRYITTNFEDLIKPNLIVNLLGEKVHSREEICSTLQFYREVSQLFFEKELDSSISIKPSQIGPNPEVQLFHLLMLKDLPTRIWIDMESSEHTEATLQIYSKFLKVHPDTGICLQANLKRTVKDIHNLPSNALVRLTKGAYKENPEIAYSSAKEIDLNFLRCLFELKDRFDSFAVATHDRYLIQLALETVDCEFQRLKGVKVDIKDPRYLSALKTYVPFGADWLPYFTRRLIERKRNLLLLLR